MAKHRTNSFPQREIGLAVLGLIFGIVITNLQEPGPFGPFDAITGTTILFIALAYRGDVGTGNGEIIAFSLIVGGALLFIVGAGVDYAIAWVKCPVILPTVDVAKEIAATNEKLNGNGYLSWYGGCLSKDAEQINFHVGDALLSAAWIALAFLVYLGMKNRPKPTHDMVGQTALAPAE